MNGFDMLTGPLAQSIGWALVHLLWQGAAIAAILAAVLALMETRSANARYLAACCALVLLLGAGFITAWRAYEPSAEERAGTAMLAAETPRPELSAPADAASAIAGQPSAIAWLPTLRETLPAIVLVWLAGVIVLSLRLMTSWLRTVRMARRAASGVDAAWQRTVTRLAEGLGLRQAVRLVESAAVEVPTVIGWMRPVILLPLSSLSGLSPGQLEMVLAHELAHIRRHDFFVNLLQAAVETLLFYHPAVWWMSGRVRIERENCCDDLAVAVCGDALQYARALTRLEELRVHDLQVAVAANGGSLLERVRRLVGAHPEAPVATPRWIAGAGVLTLLVALIALPSMPLLAQRDAPAPSPATPQAAQSQVEVHPDPSDEPEMDSNDDANTDAKTDAKTDDHADATDENTADDRASYENAVDGNGSDDSSAVDAAAREADSHDDAADESSDDSSDDSPDDSMDLPPVPPVPPTAPTAAMSSLPPAAPMVHPAPMFHPGPMAHPAPMVHPAPMIHAAPMAPPAPIVPPVPMARLFAIDSDAIRESVRQGVAGAMKPAHVHGGRPHSRRLIGESGRLSVDDLITLRTVGVTPDYVQQMRSAFGDRLTLDDVVAMRVQDVTPEYLRAMRAAGIDIQSGSDAVALAVQGVKPAFVKSLRDAGYTNLTVNDVVRLAVSGVNADYIREISKYRTGRK